MCTCFSQEHENYVLESPKQLKSLLRNQFENLSAFGFFEILSYVLLFLAKKFAPQGAFFGSGGGEVKRPAEVVGIARARRNQLVNHAPVGEAAHLAVVDEEVGLEFAAADGRAVHLLVGVVAVHGEKFHAALTAELNRLVEQMPLAYGPEYQAVSVALQHLQCGCGKGNLLANRRVFVFDDGPVEIDCYGHVRCLLSCGEAPRFA